MERPRLKSELRVAAHLRRAQAGGAFGHVARRGDPDAGAILVKVYLGGGRAQLYARSIDLNGEPVWREPFGNPVPETDIDAWIEKEARIDPDFWVVEIEDRDGRAFLEDG